MKIKRFLASVLILLAVYFGSNKILDMLQDKKNIENYGVQAAEKNKEQIVDNELLALLVGVDKNPDSDPGDFTRTDTIMLVKANTETGKIDLLSIPRDSRIKIRDEFTKANHAHAYGGIELTIQSLRNFLGLDIDYYAEVDYEAVVKIVDALGGVDYEVPEGINVKRGTYIDIKPGKNHLSGEEVLWYLRTRNIYQNGDLGRVGTQQLFMKAMIDEIGKKSSEINLSTFIQTYLSDVKTNIPIDIMLNFATKIKDFSSSKVKTYVVPGVGQMIAGISYYIPDYEKTWEIVDEVFSAYKLKTWSKADSGYDEYFGFSYDGAYDQDSITTQNSLRPQGEIEGDTTRPMNEQNFYYQNNNTTNNNYNNSYNQADDNVEYEIHTYYEYTYPDGRVEYHDQPPEWYNEESQSEQVETIEETDQGDE